MGLKLRLGLAGLGLALSSMFGVNMLSGVKDYVDTTGNIMVDIADGIGMVSKGIEALEYYLDPGSAPAEEATPPEANPAAPPIAGAPPVVPATPPTPDQPTVFCQKGKCYPYDPAKMKNPNLNLEAKPGMILTAPEPPQKNNNKRRRQSEVEDVEENKKNPSAKAKARQTVIEQNTKSAPVTAPKEDILVAQPTSTTPEAAQNTTTPVAHGTKRLLSSIKDLLDRTSKILVKVVHRIFPWNRRARRRVMGDGDDDEL